METRQNQVLASFERVRTFIEANPARGRLSYDSARAMLDDAVVRLREAAGAQHTGRTRSREELGRQRAQVRQLLNEFIRPTVRIALAQIDPGSDAGLPAGLRMPKLPLSPNKLIAVCDGMIAAARPHEAVFVANGQPADFLAQFTAARNALVRVMGSRTLQVSAHVAARKGFAVQLGRGRRAVELLDAIVRASFADDLAVLAAWRSAKRVRLTAGSSASREALPAGEVPRAA